MTADRETEMDRAKLAKDVGIEWFKVHADQRLGVFNFLSGGGRFLHRRLLHRAPDQVGYRGLDGVPTRSHPHLLLFGTVAVTGMIFPWLFSKSNP